MDNTREKLINWFETTFDAIYVIYYTGNHERLEPLKNELERVGLLQCKNFHWYYDVSSPYDEVMYENIQLYYPLREKDNIFVKKLAINHYKISKLSYDIGYKRILIMEDDIRFLKDLEMLYKNFINSPNDGDIILYDKMIYKIPQELYEKIFNENCYIEYSKFNLFNFPLSSAALYSLSSNGMKEIVENNEKYLTAADTYTNYVPSLSSINISKRYVANTNLGIQNASGYFEAHYKPFVNLELYNIDESKYKNIHTC